MKALGICSMQKKDWYYVIGGALLIFLLTGLIFGISVLLHEQLGWRLLTTNPVFMEGMKPYVGWEKLYLFVWLPMFFFNIVGEEVLWRGFIQRRMASKYAWIICGFLWAIFHLPFGIDLIIMAAPALLIIPYIFSKTQSTSVAIAIHGIYNGPIFVLISLGVIGI
jgi:membrane protease YdiL (CAAX protease family)